MRRAGFGNGLVNLGIDGAVAVFVLQKAPDVPQGVGRYPVHIQREVLLPHPGSPDVEFIALQSPLDDAIVLFANFRKTVLLEKLVEQRGQGRFDGGYLLQVVLLRIVILVQRLLQPTLRHRLFGTVLIGSLDVGLEPAGFVVVAGAHGLVADDFALDLLGLVIPKIRIDRKTGRSDQIELPAIAQTRVDGCLGLRVVTGDALFENEGYFHGSARSRDL